MKPGLFLCMGMLGGLLFSVSSCDAIGTSDIFLSEIQIAGEKTDDEFIELYNSSSQDFDLSGFQLRRKTSGGTESSIKVFDKNSTIPSHGYFLWANSKGVFATPLADAETSSSALADNNSVALFTKSGVSGVLLDSIAWGNGALFDPNTPVFSNPPKNNSFVRNLTALSWFLSDKHSPTNSHGVTYQDPLPPPPPPPPPPIVYDTGVRLSEILANPSDKGEHGEFIELYNTSSKPLSLADWTLKDASKTGHYIFPSGTLIGAQSFLVVYRETFVFALNNSDETVFLLDPNGEEKDSVSYTTTKEDISWNFSEGEWRGGTPTPGAQNQLNTLPETKEKVPKKGYRGVAVDFDAQGTDTDHDTLKYTWDFGDGHKSYKEQTSHPFKENGTYTITLKTSDGKDDTEETFTIKIESYPYLEIRITSLSANPSGKDTGNEWLLITNREKKTVNLKDYSIASGWKTLSNHPIRENFLIKPNKESRLTHAFSLFTLPNQKGRLELRAPDGKVLQKVRYKFNKPIPEDALYIKEKGSAWKWEMGAKQNPPTSEKEVPGVGNDSLVLGASDIKLEETPQPTIKNTPNEMSETIEGIRNQLSLDPDRPDPRAILAYSTHVRVPDAITLTPSPNEKSTLIVESGSSAVYAGSILARINASLNEFLNNAQ